MKYTVIGNPHGLKDMLRYDAGKEISRELLVEKMSWTDKITGTHWDYSIYSFVIEAKRCTEARWQSFGYKVER